MKKSIFLTLVAILIMGGSIFASSNEIVELRKQYKTPTANLSLELKKGSDTYNGEWVKNNVNVVVTKPSGLENMTDVYYKKEGDASYTAPVGSVYTNNTITVVFKETMDAEVTFVGVDVTGNEVTLPTSAYAIKIDKEAPKIVNVDKTATGTSVILKVEVEDLQSGVKSYAVSTSTLASTWTTLETPITNGSFNVEVNGDKSVYLWLQDSVGNVSTMQEIIIYKDITPPTGTIEIQGNKVGENTYVNSTNVTLKLTAQDNASTQNEIKMQVYNEKDFDNLVSIDDIEWQDFKEEITNWNLEEEDGQKVVYLVLKDAMGNVSVTIYGDTVNYKVHHFIKDVAGVEYALYKTTTEKTLIGKHLQLEKEKIAIKGMTYEKVSTSFDGTPTVETVVAEDGSTEIYVHYTRNKYNVTLNNGDGTYGNITVTYGGTYKNLPELTRVGYSFNGWRNAAGMLVKNSTEVTITQDEELTANWTANRYEVTLDPNGGTVDKASITVSYGSVYQNLPEPTKEGYDFTGWYNSKGEKITKDTEVTITENETLTANWEVARFEVTLNTNGGTVENTILKVLPNGTYENLPTPTREGYTFTGWYTSITDGTKIESTTTVISNAPHTLYARWQINTYTITFDSNGGTSVPSITQEYGTKITVATNPTKEGYDFYGWLPKLPSTMPAEDTTLVAEWRIAKYQITFNTDGGTAIDSIYEEYGTEITPPEDPTKEGYQFIGWDKEIPKTMPSQDMIITAQWQKVESYAVYSADDNSLTFYKNADTVTANSTYNGKTATAVYTGIEEDIYVDFKAPWFDYREIITSVKVEQKIQPISTGVWFYAFKNLTTVDLAKLDTSKTIYMYDMFSHCYELTSLDLSNFDTSNVIDMYRMFRYCTKLTELDISSFNTSKITDMSYMFEKCYELTNLDLSSFDTSNVTDMSYMFSDCTKLTIVDVSSFDTLFVSNMSYMFNNCSSLTTFNGGKGLVGDITQNGIVNSDDADMLLIYIQGDIVLTEEQIKLGDANGDGATDFSDISTILDHIWNLKRKTEAQLNFVTGNVKNYEKMFYGCSSLKVLDLTSFLVFSTADMSNMFTGCIKLEEVNLGRNFGFVGTDCYLPIPDSNYIEDADGKWYGIVQTSGIWTTETAYAPEEIPNSTASYYMAKARTSYAVYSETDNSLVFYKNRDKLAVGSTYEGQKVTAVYTGIEKSNYNSAGEVPWYEYRKNIIEVVIYEDEISPVSTAYWFYDFENMTNIYLEGLDTSNATNMNQMFYNCSSLTSLDLSSFNTENVTNMGGMFYNCSSLKTLDISGFDTSSVTANRDYMFGAMWKLQEIKLGAGFAFADGGYGQLPAPNSSYISGADGNWYNKDTGACYIPSEVPDNISATYSAIPVYVVTFNANGGQIEDLGATTTTRRVMLGKTYNDGSDKIPTAVRDGYEFLGWNTKKDGTGTTITGSTDIDETANGLTLYAQWEELEAYAVYSETDNSLTFYKNKDTVTVGEMYNGKIVTAMYTGIEESSYTIYRYVPWLDKTGDITKIELANEISPISTANWFALCGQVTEIDLSKLNTSKVTDMNGMFVSCSKLKSLDLSKFDTSKVTDMHDMFRACNSLTTLNLSNFDTSNVKTSMYGMFHSCINLTTLDLSNFNTSKVTTMQGMFYNCSSLKTLNISSKFKTSNVTDMNQMFYNCSSLTSLDLSSFNTENVTNMGGMFYNCSSLKTLDISGFDTSSVTANRDYMFGAMWKLQEIKLGAGFAFADGGYGQLPAPNSSYISGADGNWYNKDTGACYIPSEVPDNTSATYSAIPVYVVTFNANGGQIEDLGATTTTRRVTLGKTYDEGSDKIPTAVRDGYEFLGWNTKKDGTGTTITGSTDIDETANGLTLYAQWEAVLANMVTKGEYINYNVSYNNVSTTKEGTHTPTSNYSGWRVLSITEENGEKYVNIVPEGVPMSYIHSSTATNPGQTGETNLTTGFFNTAINSTYTNDTYHLCGFKNTSGNVITTISDLKSMFANNKYTLVESGVPKVRSMIKSDIDNYIGSVTENETYIDNKYDIFLITTDTDNGGVYAPYYLATVEQNKYLWAMYKEGAIVYTHYEAGVRPVVTLKATVKTTGKDENGIWQLK